MDVNREMIREAFRKDQSATTVLLARLWLQSHPNDRGILLDYAEMLYKMTRYEEALTVYENALATGEEDIRWAIFNQIGRIYQYRGQPDQAESWFRKAIEDQPDELASYMFLGACQARQGKLEEAETTHRSATKLTESWLLEEAYHNLGLVLRGQCRLSEAAECFRKAIEIDPKYVDATDALADVELAMKFTRSLQNSETQ